MDAGMVSKLKKALNKRSRCNLSRIPIPTRKAVIAPAEAYSGLT